MLGKDIKSMWKIYLTEDTYLKDKFWKNLLSGDEVPGLDSFSCKSFKFNYYGV